MKPEPISDEQSEAKKCYGCHEPLPNGVSFCVACGKHNLSSNASKVAVAKTELATQKSRELWKRIKYWCRTRGLRR